MWSRCLGIHKRLEEVRSIFKDTLLWYARNFSKIKNSQTDNDGNNSKDLAPPPNADEIFKKIKETELIPNAIAMLDGLCKDGLVQKAIKIFGLMRQKGSMPEVVVYT